MSDPDKRQLGLETMRSVYGMEFGDGAGDWFGITAEHLFAEIWNREGLSMRDRRLLLLGLLMGRGLDDVVGLQVGSALRVGDLSEDDLREIVIFLSYYAGWPSAAKLNSALEAELARRKKPD